MLGATLATDAYLGRLNQEVSRIDQAAMQRWADLIYQAWENERFVFIFGNGGSGTTASHMAEDLGKSTLHEHDLKDESKKRLKVLSLTDNAGWMMAVGNDLAYDQIFVWLDGLQWRQAEADAEARAARRTRRHGNGREHTSVPVPLGA
jgi:D-sedoheptulose 7-phosphate isomerase